MFKLAVALLVVGVAALDTESPVISLEMQGDHHVKVCEVSQNGQSSCPMPNVEAFDHHEGNILDKVSYKVYVTKEAAQGTALVTQTLANDAGKYPDGKSASALTPVCTENDVSTAACTTDQSRRAAFRIEYTVSDAQNNQAYALYEVDMKDTASPQDETTANDFWEQHSEYCVNTLSNAGSHEITDAFDQNQLKWSDSSPFPTDACAVSGSKTIRVCDWANIFGTSNADNCVNRDISWTITDTTKPVMTNGNYALLAGTFNGNSKYECIKDATYDTVDPETIGWSCNDCGDNCKGQHTDVTASRTSMNAQHGWISTVTVQCTDWTGNNQETWVQQYEVRDTRAPDLSFTAPSSTTSTVGSGTGSFSDSHTAGQNFYQANAASNTNLASSGVAHSVLIQHSAGFVADRQQMEEIMADYTCTDDCKGSITASVTFGAANSVTSCDAFTGNTANTAQFDSALNQVGTYMLKYTCTDDVHTTTACRTIYNQDHTKPIVNVPEQTNNEGPCSGTTDKWCIEASATAHYIDSGATCSDNVDGHINDEVVVSGAVVDLTKLGTYELTYRCTDSSGNFGTNTKSVVVYDSICPTCDVNTAVTNDNANVASELLTVEASFPYADAPVGCSDNVGFNDADKGKTMIATDITGTLIGVGASLVNPERTGTYVLTYSVTDQSGNTDLVKKNGQACSEFHGGAKSHTRTVVVLDTMRPIITVDESNFALMAESTSSVNGWVIGAVASAITGIALFGFASRSTAPTSVPV